ncbi:MAG: ankyrin repeat domain-containing protein, partial [Ginsengibacter sp.]
MKLNNYTGTFYFSLIITFSVLFLIQEVKAQQLPLFVAVKNNNIKEIKMLLDKGANPNAYDDDSDNVLINAALYASVDCMKLVLQNKANPNLKNKYGQTP